MVPNISLDGLDINVHCPECGGTGKVNKPTTTCLAIGPDEAEKIDKITGELKLL
jgi:peptidyl-tRNA hydrolase